MGYVRVDLGEAHEGCTAYVFADGRSGATRQGTSVRATTDVLGRPIPFEQWHDAADVLGWIPTCACGWRDAPLIRVHASADMPDAGRTSPTSTASPSTGAGRRSTSRNASASASISGSSHLRV